MLYVILDGTQKDELVFIEAFVDQDEAIQYLLDLSEENKKNNYRLIEFKATRVII